MNWPFFFSIEMKNTLLFAYSANILVRLLSAKKLWKSVLPPKIRKYATPF